jgi:hypothetical protein
MKHELFETRQFTLCPPTRIEYLATSSARGLPGTVGAGHCSFRDATLAARWDDDLSWL